MIVLRQKSYGRVGRFIDKLSGGRISKYLEKSIEKDRELRDLAKENNKFNRSSIIDKNVENNLIKEARKKKIKVVNTNLNPIFGNKIIDTKDVNDDYYNSFRELIGSKKVKLLKDSSKDNDYQILHPVKSGTDILAKNISDLDNAIPGPGIKKFLRNNVSRGSRDKKNVDEFLDSLYDNDNSSGIVKGISRYFKGSPVAKNELNSTKNGLKLLKKSGMNKEDLEKATQNFKYNDDIYKYGSKVFYKTPLLNSMKKKPKKT